MVVAVGVAVLLVDRLLLLVDPMFVILVELEVVFGCRNSTAPIDPTAIMTMIIAMGISRAIALALLFRSGPHVNSTKNSRKGSMIKMLGGRELFNVKRFQTRIRPQSSFFQICLTTTCSFPRITLFDMYYLFPIFSPLYMTCGMRPPR